MTQHTPVNNLPYPEDGEAPDGPVQIGALAAALDVLKWGSRNIKPTVGLKEASGGLLLTGSYVDVPGTEFEVTPAVASNIIVAATFLWSLERTSVTTGQLSGNMSGALRIDETDYGPTLPFFPAILNNVEQPSGSSALATPQTLFYVKPLSAAKHTLKLRAKGSAASGVQASLTRPTQLLYLLVAS